MVEKGWWLKNGGKRMVVEKWWKMKKIVKEFKM